MPRPRASFLAPVTLLAAVAVAVAGCRSGERSAAIPNADAAPEPAMAADRDPDAERVIDASAAAPPPRIAAWMERLTIAHHYDPSTGFIVADEVIALPAALAAAPDARTLVERGRTDGRPVVVFATADRCAPCQQFKKDAINDARVLAMLDAGRVLATHVEVDREPDVARDLLGGPAIPMTYVLRDGAVVATLRGQRSADDLVAFLETEAG